MYVDDGARRSRILGRLGRRGALRRGLLENYLGEARALAARGGGNLWVVEPRLSTARLRRFTAAVGRYVGAGGVRTGAVKVLAGSSSARIEVLAAEIPPEDMRRRG